MNGMAVAGVALILLGLLGMGLLGGWAVPTGWNGWMPHMGWGRNTNWMPHMGWSRSTETGVAQAPVAGAPMLGVSFVDFAFSPREIRVKAGQPVNLRISNQGGILHDLTIPTLGYQAVVQPGQQSTVGMSVSEPGTYEFFCSVPGHREAGMVGRLIVERL